MSTSAPKIVDADTHVIEPVAMWDLLDPELYPRRPVVVSVPDDTLYGTWNAMWLIDGNVFPKSAGKGGFLLHTPSASIGEQARGDTGLGARELTDIPTRLADMDRTGVDVQVIYPTLFLVYLTDDPALEVGLCQAYNRWLGNAWKQSNNRLRWTAILPLKTIDASISQMREAKEHGAVGLLFRGIEGSRTLDDPYFAPIYEEAASLDLPVCVHLGAGNRDMINLYDIKRNGTFPTQRLPLLSAFRDIVSNKIPEQHPGLRFAFVEVGANWVPHVLYNLKRSFGGDDKWWGPRLFDEYGLYVTCEPDEDIPYLTKYIGEDHLMMGTDYGHADPATELKLFTIMRNRDDISPAFVDKLLGGTARRVYGL